MQEVLELHSKYLVNEPGGKIANLSGADLSEADLSGANLFGVDLSEANLSGANLFWADLSEANLSGANLFWANLFGANLFGANLFGANLSEANLSEADLSEAKGLPLSAEEIRELRRAVHEQIRLHPESHVQGYWHSSCGSKHCVAGWTIVKAGDIGKKLKSQLGTATAANLLLGGKRRPSFNPDEKTSDILADLLHGVESNEE
jgi:uncharacterized protein YjbI with pentapeptide repeats